MNKNSLIFIKPKKTSAFILYKVHWWLTQNTVVRSRAISCKPNFFFVLFYSMGFWQLWVLHLCQNLTTHFQITGPLQFKRYLLSTDIFPSWADSLLKSRLYPEPARRWHRCGITEGLQPCSTGLPRARPVPHAVLTSLPSSPFTAQLLWPLDYKWVVFIF